MKLPHPHEQDRGGERCADTQLDGSSREPSNYTGSPPCANDGRGHEKHESLKVDLDYGDVQKRLENGRQRVPHVHGSRNKLVRYHTAQFEDGCGRCEGADPECVEKVRHKANGKLKQRRIAFRLFGVHGQLSSRTATKRRYP